MRILIADRNARLLESISRTFARQFTIQAATTHEHCNALLLQCEFDLAVVSEKLADGPGLKLLGQIARDSPDTLRVFTARRARLELLKGKLGPFGLFRTLAYPIDPQVLLSALTLARSGLEVDAPALEIRGERKPRNVPAPAASPRTIEGISLTSADAAFAINVPMAIASLGELRRSNSSAAPRVVPAAPQPSASRARGVAPESAGDAPRSQQTAVPRPQTVAPQLTATRHPLPAPASLQLPAVRSTPPRLNSHSEMFELIEEPCRTANSNRVVFGSFQRRPMRTKLVLGATVAAVFLVTTLTLNLFDASVHITRASTPRPEVARSNAAAPPPRLAPVLTAPFSPAPSVAHRVGHGGPMGQPGGPMGQPKPVAANPDEPEDPQIAASTTVPMADPSTFGSEAYEPIYSN
jgi:DNA-binding NarL/FixJ family response regulator